MDAATVCKLIQQHLASKLGVSPEAVNPSERFRRLGVDSLAALAMLAELGKHLGRPLSPTLAWQFPTPSDLARHLAGEAGGGDVPTEGRRSRDEEPIAIVGLSCRLPGAPDPEAFWRLLRDGVDAIREVPRDRWDVDALYDADLSAPGKMSTRFGGFLDDVGSFDASFFGISPREAAEIDPQQRLMLELSWEALEDSGVHPAKLKDTRAGVFFGAMWMDYTRVPGASADRIAPHTATGQDLSIVPARVSYTLGLLGPSVAVNTACSSSLVAVHLARHSLLRGESSLALAGGVNLILSPESTIAMSKFGAMAPDGRSKAFDARANGYVRGEGGGVVVLKRLSDAIADGDRIYCIIRGSAINNDGFSNGLTAPSPRAQEAVIRDACADARIEHHQVQYVEAHGTGTMLGDPIEAGALGAVLGTGRGADRPLRIGSVKTNFGHLEAAAGVAGLIKVALSMAHRELPASLHFQKPNPHIPFEDLRIRVQAKHEPWQAEGGRRIAGVSSFGFGGTNSHVVVESTDEVEPRVVRLAASTPAALLADAGALATRLRASAAVFDAMDVPTGGPHRLAVRVLSAEHLASELDRFVRGKPSRSLAVGSAAAESPRVALVFGGLRLPAPAEETTKAAEPSARPRVAELVVLSGRTWEAVSTLAGRVRSQVEGHPEHSLGDVAYSLMASRSSGEHRAALTVTSRDGLLEGLGTLSRGERVAGASKGEPGSTSGKVAWLFTGQGAQVAGMGRGLYEAWPAFRVALDEAFGCLDAHLERPLREVMWGAVGSAEATLLDQTGYTQPALFALEWALACLWRSWGVEPALLAGHSIGEVAAACVAGVFTLADASRLVCARGRLMQALPSGGAMMAIEASESEVSAAVAAYASTVSVAAVNGPTSVVIAGSEASVLEIASLLSSRKVRSKRLVVSHAFHSPLMEPMLGEFRRVAESVSYHPAKTALVSNLSGALAGPEVSTAAYWVRHVREAVRFADGVKTLEGVGVTAYVEIGPRSTLLGLVSGSLSGDALLLPSIQSGRPESESVLEALGALYVRGQELDPKRLFPEGARRASLPATAWQWIGVGQALLRSEPVARATIERCDRALKPRIGWSILEYLRSDKPIPAETPELLGPLAFAIEVAIADALRARGLRVDAVVGDGDGDLAAAHVSGMLALEEAARRVGVRYARPPGQRAVAGGIDSAIDAGGTLRLSAGDLALTVRRVAEDGASTERCVFVEVAPQPDLTGDIARGLAQAARPGAVVACAAGDEAETFTLLDSVARLFVAGCEVREASSGRPRVAELVVLSGRTWEAVSTLAGRVRSQLEGHPEHSLGDVAYSLMASRSSGEHRLALTVSSRARLLEGLGALSRGEHVAGASKGEPGSKSGKVAWLFTGQGAQVAGMGRGLYEGWPAFRAALDEAFGCLDAHLERPLREVMWGAAGSAEAALLDQTGYTQPALFALEWALACLWRSWGVEPALLAGHSIGEVAAACVAGVFTLADAARLVCARGRLMQALPPGGAMMAIEASESEVSAAVGAHASTVSMAAVNGPSSVVIAGSEASVLEIASSLSARKVRTKRLVVSHAFHSPLMEPMLGEFRRVAESVSYHPAKIALVSNLSGVLAGPEVSTAAYWVRHVREAVRFADGVKTLDGAGVTAYVEIGPRSTLLGMASGSLTGDALLLPSVQSGRPESESVLEALGALYVRGQELDPKRLFPEGARRVPLPTYPWQRERYWLDSPAGDSGRGTRRHAGGHPLLGEATTLSTQAGTWVWETTLGLDRLPWLGDHRVQGAIVFPGAGYVEMALAAGAQLLPDADLEVADVEISQVLALQEKGSTLVQVVASELRPGSWSVQVASRASDAPGTPWTVHARSTVRRGRQDVGTSEKSENGAAAARVDLASLQRGLGEPTEAASLYASFDRSGLAYGPAFRGVLHLRRRDREVLGRIALAEQAGAATAYKLHPALLDACLQVVEAALADGGTATWLPVRIGSLQVRARPSGALWCHVRVAPDDPAAAGRRTADFGVFDDAGVIVAQVAGVVMKEVANGAARQDDGLLSLDWQAATLPAPRVARGRWLIIGERSGLAKALGASLEASGHAVVHAVRDTTAEGARALLGEAFGSSAPTTIVHMRSLEGGGEPDPIEAAIERGCDSILRVVQGVAAMGWRDAPRLWVVTRGAQAVQGNVVDVAQSPAIGLARVIAMEHAELRCARVDLDPAAPAAELQDLMGELLADDAEDEIAWRHGKRWVARLSRVSAGDGPVDRIEPAKGRSFRLSIDKPGVLDRLALWGSERRAPARGEVEIEVEAAGINFLDVLLALGVMPDDVPGAVAGSALGLECAGRVIAVGDGVTEFAPGDAVIALGRGALASHLTTVASLVVRRPAVFTAAQAASVPIAYLTAWYALDKVARLRRGERVLIHAATGGVGLAAVKWAQHLGAEVYATAGTPEKRALLEEMGVRFVSDSRSDRFVADVLEWTKGEGVDVVLNSLAGDLIEKSFGLLRAYGRFVEIGKRDYYANSSLGLRPFLRNLAFSLVDLRGMMFERPALVHELLEELMAHFESGVFAVPPVETFPVSRAQDAFRKMAQARHIGKLALTFGEPDVSIHVPATGALRIRRDGTYLVTGGLGGLGLSLARWLGEHGAGHIVLAGRAGMTTDEQRAAVRSIEERGTAVTVAALDVADGAAVAVALAAIPGGRPLRGVFHAAGLVDDGLLAGLTPARFRGVMAPKIKGAWNLHTLTQGAELDLFVMYSSAVGLLGLPGQGNYAAANTFLDALAHLRRAEGRPAVSIDWGAFADVGLAAAQANRGQRMEGRGLRSLKPEEGLVALERVLARGEPQVAVLSIDVQQWLEFFPAAASYRMLARLLEEQASSTRPAGESAILERLAAAKPEARPLLVEGIARDQVALVLRIPSEKIGRDVPLSSLGMDSLMGLELRNRLEAVLGIRLPAGALWTYPTLAALSSRLASNGEDEAKSIQPPAAAPAADDRVTKEVADMASGDLLSFMDTLLDRANQGPT
jgi:acyl transferase domain-containing protein/NADPH:quinone reductase-like Zn-dependent oxidoreductase/acyl carrier protein